MKKILVIFPCVLYLICAAQKQNSLNHPYAENVKNDTTFRILKDTFKANNTKKDIQVLIVKNEENDWFVHYIYPIILVLLGAGISSLTLFLKERREIIKFGQRWWAEFNFLKVPITEQVRKLEEMLATYSKDEYVFENLFTIEGTDCEIFKSLDKSNLIKFLKRKNSSSDAIRISNEINGIIHIIQTNTISLWEEYKIFLNATSKHIGEFSDNLNALTRALNDYAVLLEEELGTDPLNDVRYTAFYNLFDKHILNVKDGNFDLFQLNENFFKALIPLFYPLRLDHGVDSLKLHVVKGIDLVKQIKQERIYLIDNIKTIISIYNKQLIELPNVQQHLI